jgi:ankyrin repeat protein
MNNLQIELLALLDKRNQNQDSISTELNTLIAEYGTRALKRWYNTSCPKKNTLLHELVERNLDRVLILILDKSFFDINARRMSDGLTPFQLAKAAHNDNICKILQASSADMSPVQRNDDWLSADEKEIRRSNLVWCDLEFTSLKNPEILECAVIITDKDLREKARRK